MSSNLPNQSSFLYEANWTPAIDSLLLRTVIRLKLANNWDGTTFPSHFILEAKAVIEQGLGYAFEWYELVDRLHFLEKRYKTFKELSKLSGTYWESHSNIVIVNKQEWAEMVKRNPLAGAYYSHGDPAYYELCEMFALHNVKAEEEKTVVVLSDSPDSYQIKGEEPSCNQATPARRKLSFNEGYPPSAESSSKKPPAYYITGADGKLQKKGGNNLPTGPNIYNSAVSSSPIIRARMPRKPTF